MLLDDLPAVYREDAASASQLRRLLTPFEVLLDGLDARIDALPARIDPATADERMRFAIGQRYYLESQRVTLTEQPRSANSSDLLIAAPAPLFDELEQLLRRLRADEV